MAAADPLGMVFTGTSAVAVASSVSSGIVLTVFGAARPSTYRVLDAVGSLVPVLANRSRWAGARGEQPLPADPLAKKRRYAT